jgi:DNA-directed RNA polymerase subunit alpha
MEKSWVKYKEESPTYGQFVAEPLDRGYGTTLGNSIRRVLLSSLGGAAVTNVKIDGVDHEFSTIPGVKEDVLDILMNIKGLVLRCHSDEAKEITLTAKGDGVVKAKDIKHDDEIEIINPAHEIATLNKDGKLNITMTVENGIGYKLADIAENKKHAIGTIPLDDTFSPIFRENHKV